MTKKANLPETGELLETPVEQVSDESVEVGTTTHEEAVEPKYTLALPAEQKPTKTEKKTYGAPEIEIVAEGGKKKVSLAKKYSKIVEVYTNKVVGQNTDSFDYEFATPDTVLFELFE